MEGLQVLGNLSKDPPQALTWDSLRMSAGPKRFFRHFWIGSAIKGVPGKPRVPCF